MRDFKQLQDRYENDPSFRSLVRSLYHLIDQMQLSPSEIREAAMFACYQHEMLHGKSVLFRKPE